MTKENRENFLPPLLKICLLLIFCFAGICSSNKYICNASDRQEITSGELYNDVISFCPLGKIYNSDGALQFDVTSALDMSNGSDAAALQFVQTAARLLSCDGISDYTDIVIGVFDENTLSTISIVNFKSVGSFSCSLTANSSLEGFDASAQDYYNEIFGCHDLNSASGNGDNLWLYSTFYGQLSGYENDGASITITVPSDNSQPSENVVKFTETCNRSTQNFLDIYNADSSQLSFDSFNIEYTDAATSSSLVTAKYYIEGSKLMGKFSFSDLNFLSEYRNGTSSSASSSGSASSGKEVPYTLAYGKLLDANSSGGANMNSLVIKAKIEPNLTNRLTITQNYQNVIQMVQGGDYTSYDEIQYWAVADMSDGSEGKVISFTVDKSCIEAIAAGTIASGDTLEGYLTDLWILPSLQE